MTKPKYFKPYEFQGWYEYMDEKIFELLDKFRERWGKPVRISSATGAVGRRMAASSKSMHNITRWGKVRAVDIMPEGISNRADLRRAFDIAKEVGFTGIGVYPDWKPSMGLHVDNRPDRTPGDPATWSALKINGVQQYFGVDKGF